MAIVHRVLQQDSPKLRLLLDTFRSVRPQVKCEIFGQQKWLHRQEIIQISAWYFVVCWKSGGNQLLRNFTSMRYAARDVWAQFELLLLQQRVLYIKSAAHTTQAKLRMVVPKQLVEQALVEVHDGVAGAHLGGMQSLMKIKARFQRPGTTKEVHCYCNRCLTCAKCKPRGKPRALLWSFTSGNPMQHMSQKTAI